MAALIGAGQNDRMSVPGSPQYRAELDFEITFANGGGLRGEGFRIDVAGPDLSDAELGAALVADLGLLMADEVRIRARRVFPDRHKRPDCGMPTSVT
jgi:hypothetical protein